jgi:PAS domain S-box-containing protein
MPAQSAALECALVVGRECIDPGQAMKASPGNPSRQPKVNEEDVFKAPPSPESLVPPSNTAPRFDLEGVARQLLDARAESLTVVDRAGKIILLNESASRRFGKSAAALVGTSLWESYPVDKQEHQSTLLNEVLATGQPVSFIDQSQGRWEETLLLPLIPKDDHVEAVVLHTRDVSRMISAEETSKRAVLRLTTIQEDERRRIAQDLHDDIGQRMAALTLTLHALADAGTLGNTDLIAQTTAATRTLEDIIRQVRQISYQLHPPSLDGMALAEVLSGFCASFAETAGVNIEFNSQDALPTIGEAEATACYRFVQEGLANAAKHSQATTIWISLDCTDRTLTISLEDNGQGFDPANVSSGMGLRGIRERFLALNGSVEIETALGNGTRLTGFLPAKQEHS